MKRSVLACAALALTGAAAAPVAAQPAAWTGTYAYNEPLGRDAVGQGMSIFVDHRLTLGANACRLTALGYQTNTAIRCTAKAAGDRLDIAFVSFGDGKVTNAYGVKLYDVGQTLFSLKRQGGGVMTTWGAYRPGLEGHEKPGVYFKRAG